MGQRCEGEIGNGERAIIVLRKGRVKEYAGVPSTFVRLACQVPLMFPEFDPLPQAAMISPSNRSTVILIGLRTFPPRSRTKSTELCLTFYFR